MRIFVTGGAGRIGRYAVDRLVAQGHDVTAIVRSPSTTSEVGLNRATREVVGEASDTSLLIESMAGVDAVLHLAAIPGPTDHTAKELLVANTVTTMAVLEAAGNAGVAAVGIASSISILGLAWADELMTPAYLPIDELHPLWPTEGYALSKECDEAAARMASRRWQMPVVAMRFPFTADHDAIQERRRHACDDPSRARQAAKELWAYLDVRDAARACELALTAAVDGGLPGATVLNIIADDLLVDEPLGELVDRWHSSLAADARANGFRGAYDLGRARDALGFSAEYLVDHVV